MLISIRHVTRYTYALPVGYAIQSLRLTPVSFNGQRVLASYEDYRFRGPRALLFQESFERALGSTPVGVWVAADQGRVARSDGTGDTFRASYAAGLTLRAGGFPVVLLSFATGGSEGHHVALTINTSLLGGSARPSLF